VGAAVRAGINASEIEDRLSGGAEAVGAFDGDRQSKKVQTETKAVIEGNAGRRRILRLAANPRGCIADLVVPARSGLVLKGQSEIAVLIALKRIVGYAKELEGIRITVRCSGVTAGETQLGCRVDCESEIGDVGPVVKRAVGNAVAGVKAGELAEIVETV